MFRIVYSVLLPFLTPFLLFWIKRRLSEKPLVYPVKSLVVIGLGLVLIFLFVFSKPERASTDSIYTPPKFENGKIIPAHMDRKNNAD